MYHLVNVGASIARPRGRVHPEAEGLSHGLKTCHRHVFHPRFARAGLSSPAQHKQKIQIPEWVSGFFGTPEGTRTPNPRNRNPMLYPLSHRRVLFDSLSIIAVFFQFVKG